MSSNSNSSIAPDQGKRDYGLTHSSLRNSSNEFKQLTAPNTIVLRKGLTTHDTFIKYM